MIVEGVSEKGKKVGLAKIDTRSPRGSYKRIKRTVWGAPIRTKKYKRRGWEPKISDFDIK